MCRAGWLALPNCITWNGATATATTTAVGKKERGKSRMPLEQSRCENVNLVESISAREQKNEQAIWIGSASSTQLSSAPHLSDIVSASVCEEPTLRKLIINREQLRELKKKRKRASEEREERREKKLQMKDKM